MRISDWSSDVCSSDLLMEFRGIIIESNNRRIRFCKYVKRHLNLREVSIIDLLDQETALCTPDWRTIEGKPIRVADGSIGTGITSIPGLGFLDRKSTRLNSSH